MQLPMKRLFRRPSFWAALSACALFVLSMAARVSAADAGARVLEEIHALMLERQLERRLEGPLRIELETADVLVLVGVNVVEETALAVEPPRAEERSGGILLPGVPADRGLPRAGKPRSA